MDNVHTLQNTIQNCIKLHSNPKISEEMARRATYQSNCPPRQFSALLSYFLNFLHILQLNWTLRMLKIWYIA